MEIAGEIQKRKLATYVRMAKKKERNGYSKEIQELEQKGKPYIAAQQKRMTGKR